MSHIQEIKNAIRRAKSMGKYHVYKPDFEKHKLATPIDNYLWLIQDKDCFYISDKTLEDLYYSEGVDEVGEQYYLSMQYQLKMAKIINSYIDNNKISGDEAAEYWLEIFYYNIFTICDWEKLSN